MAEAATEHCIRIVKSLLLEDGDVCDALIPAPSLEDELDGYLGTAVSDAVSNCGGEKFVSYGHTLYCLRAHPEAAGRDPL